MIQQSSLSPAVLDHDEEGLQMISYSTWTELEDK